MEVLFSQKYRYAKIIATKNYTTIEKYRKARKTLTTFYSDLDELDDEFLSFDRKSHEITQAKTTPSKPQFSSSFTKPKTGLILQFNSPHTHYTKKGKPYVKNGKFFYDGNENTINQRIQLDYVYPHNGNVFFTTKGHHIQQHYFNPFSAIEIKEITRIITKDNNKITLFTDVFTKTRGVNHKYFKTKLSRRSLTLDLSSGNFTTLKLEQVGRRVIVKNFRTNWVGSIDVHDVNGFLSIGKIMALDCPLYDEFKKIFDDDEFNIALSKYFGIEDFGYTYTPEKFINNFITRFVELKKIKVPNQYHHWIKHLYPTEKYLKKNDRKLISSILDYYSIKSKVTIKILHLYPDIDVIALVKLAYLLGENFPKYIGNLTGLLPFKSANIVNHDLLNYRFMTEKYGDLKPYKNHNFNITNNEKENIMKIVNNSETRSDIITELYDHFRMIKSLRNCGLNVSLKAKTYIEFHEEHMEYSKLFNKIRKGTIITYEFDKDMVNKIEAPIELEIPISVIEKSNEKYSTIPDNPFVVFGRPFASIENTEEIELSNAEPTKVVTFIPHILKTEDEFLEEGNYMHHCVASYVNHENTIIISLRTENNTNRITSEYETINGNCRQSRHFCNQPPPMLFKQALEILKQRVITEARKKRLKYINKTRTPVLINGIPIDPIKLTEYNPINNFDF